MMIISRVVFQAKQILSIFLEYLVEQSLLLQHEYKWSTISSRNQQTKTWFLYYSVAVCNSHFKSYLFTFMTFIFLCKCHVSIFQYYTIDRHFFMIMSCSHRAFICAYQLKANMQEPGDGWFRISRCRPPLSIEPPSPPAHWPCGLADAQHKIACPPYSPGPRAPSTF